MKKIFSLLLASLACSVVFTATAFAESNITMEISPAEVKAGETVTVKLSVGDIKAATFSGGVAFDKSKLTLTSIVGTDPEYPDDFGLYTSRSWAMASASPSISGANSTGRCGMTMSSNKDVAYLAGTFITATFKVNDNATGDLVFNVFEVYNNISDGVNITNDGQTNPDGSVNAYASTQTISIAADEPDEPAKDLGTAGNAFEGKASKYWTVDFDEWTGAADISLSDGTDTKTINVTTADDSEYDIAGAVSFYVYVIGDADAIKNVYIVE